MSEDEIRRILDKLAGIATDVAVIKTEMRQVHECMGAEAVRVSSNERRITALEVSKGKLIGALFAASCCGGGVGTVVAKILGG